jgi:DNA polymerase-3 subunit gamma/tau
VYRDLLIAKTASDRSDLVAMTSAGWTRLVQLAQSLPIPNILLGQQHLRSAELQIRNSNQPRLWLEVTLMGLLPSAQAAIAASASSQPQLVPARNINIPPTPQVAATNPVPFHPIIETPIPSGSNDLNQLWQNILAMLPAPTKSVFIQIQAHILEIDNNSVKLGLAGKRDETTKHIVVQKRPELEQVFGKYLQRSIKVMFTFVTAPSQDQQVQSPAIAPPAPNLIPQSNPLPPTNISNPVVTPISPAINTTINTTINNMPISSPVTTGYVETSEDDRVIKNLAHLFNGQIIDLDEDSNNDISNQEPEQEH